MSATGCFTQECHEYRPARALRLYWEEGERQQVVALAEGDRDRMEAFLKAIQTNNKPELG